MSARARAHAHRVVKAWGCLELNAKMIAQHGAVVQEGPFAGLRLSPMTQVEHLGPFLLGVYESELDPAWELVLSADYRQIVDVGAKFGYYAAGLARRFPAATVMAFDTDRWARRALREMAQANGLVNLQVLGYCDADWLAAHLEEGALLLSDCEGYEDELFGSRAIPRLESAVLIIETHDEAVPGVTSRLDGLLASSHVLHRFASGRRRRCSTRNLDFLSDTERQLANQEVRSPQQWLLALPRSGPHQRLSELATALIDDGDGAGAKGSVHWGGRDADRGSRL
jgi:hypothetical protein